MLRVKNEARWIERVLQSMLPVCERIFVFDDHSEDGTPFLCARCPQVDLHRSWFDGLNEVRDKNFLLKLVDDYAAEIRSRDLGATVWVLHIDGDEEIAPGGCDELKALAVPGTGPDCYRFQVLYLWDREDQIRVDRWYRDFRRPSFFRLSQGARFRSANGGGFHCGNVPEPRQIGDCGVKLLHYGYLHREDRIRKYEWYNAPDKQPVPEYEDGYKHICIGDLFPADSVFRHAGPLQLAPLPHAIR